MVRRGEIWWADLGDNLGSELSFIRPVLVMQANQINRSAFKTVVVIGITSNLNYADVPGNVYIKKKEGILPKDSVICVAHIESIDKQRFKEKIGDLSEIFLDQVGYGVSLVMELK